MTIHTNMNTHQGYWIPEGFRHVFSSILSVHHPSCNDLLIHLTTQKFHTSTCTGGVFRPRGAIGDWLPALVVPHAGITIRIILILIALIMVISWRACEATLFTSRPLGSGCTHTWLALLDGIQIVNLVAGTARAILWRWSYIDVLQNYTPTYA
jgi:hypothetical protein